MATRLRVGLVLGGGGVTGLAYHAGALSALEIDLGWDPRDAQLVVGTSAGAVVAGLLRRGVAPTDLAARAVGIEPAGSHAHLSHCLVTQPEMPPFGLRHLLRLPRLPSPALVAATLRRPHRIDPISTFMGLLADGALDGAHHHRELWEALDGDWPALPTWACAVRQRDLRRVVFGRDAEAPFAEAVAASCAVPAYFTKVEIGGSSYLDGGVHSPTNAGVVAGEDLDLVIVSSPMSGRSTSAIGLDAWSRRYAGSKLRRELDLLRARGIPTVVLEPGPDVVEVLGSDVMDGRRLREIVGAALLDAGSQLQAPVTRTLVEGLRHVGGAGPAPSSARRVPA
ncbi:patatin-like phospholipase family protein [Dermatobacter hominis]|uniref:patatin-like phospholipase family protein n=1 Tax=Dermatobacter hominis TaxID=2884263 RepID=UPI001D12D7BE|nr:patatin-like phospholipase family protein [Dermatobacter hominis]UDY37539.1 patatin-like phospholipase family protein [Dermatobacter hominis]